MPTFQELLEAYDKPKPEPVKWKCNDCRNRKHFKTIWTNNPNGCDCDVECLKCGSLV